MNAEAKQQSLVVAEQVRDFYDRYPYPQPIECLDSYRRLWHDPGRRRADYHLTWPALPYRERQSILVAGCGTSQAAKHALRWPAAQVTGIDISATSVRCTADLKRRYDLRNLTIHQLPVERASGLGMDFDQIVCTGVLHHLADPDAGLRVLRSVLKPTGAMHLMVYAPYGRAGIYMLQEFCRRAGIRAADNDIQDLISALRALPNGHPLANLLREAPDFRHEAALADALLHPQDRAYSVPQLFEFIEKAGLTFQRWVRQAPYSPQCGLLAGIPQASRISELPLKEQYAAVELFRGTMVRHSLIACREDCAGGSQQVSFAGDAWPRFVPIRMSDTICIQDRAPAGTAAVLINRSHTFRDLVAPIDATEKRLFEAIDGNASIGDILSSSGADLRPEMVRDFFERLWLYDQIVFDASDNSKPSVETSESLEAQWT